jgi:hypothetical protein
MAMNREQATTVLNRLGTTAADATVAMNVIIDFLISEGNADVANAFMTRLNATSTISQAGLNQTLVAKTTNLNYAGKSHHERL